MSIKWLALDHKRHVGKLTLIQHTVNADPEAVLLLHGVAFLDWRAEVGARIGIKYVDILKVVLAITATNDVKFAVDERHGMAGSRIWVRIVFSVEDVVAVLPGGRFWVESVQIIEAVCVRTAASEQVELVIDVAQFHACARCRALAHDFHLRPGEGRYLKHKQIIQSLRAVPAAKYVQLVFDYT